MTRQQDPPRTEVDLDEAAIGDALLCMVAGSAMLRHQTVGNTARDYMTGLTSPEARFVRDVLTRSTTEVCDRWLGGVDKASKVGTELVSMTLESSA